MPGGGPGGVLGSRERVACAARGRPKTGLAAGHGACTSVMVGLRGPAPGGAILLWRKPSWVTWGLQGDSRRTRGSIYLESDDVGSTVVPWQPITPPPTANRTNQAVEIALCTLIADGRLEEEWDQLLPEMATGRYPVR